MQSTWSIYRFVLIMTVSVAFLLTFLFTAWKDQSDTNEAIFNKKAIMKSLPASALDNADISKMGDDAVLNLFKTFQQYAINTKGEVVDSTAIKASGYKSGLPEKIDMKREKKKPEGERIMPLYVFDSPEGTYYILSLRGSGLWDEIWGNISIKDDMRTIAGASFDHKGETPGLGAEIKDNPAFAKMFAMPGKERKITNDAGEVAIYVRKGGARDERYEVDGISGATVTADGVTEMLQRCVKYYLPYFNSIKTKQPTLQKG